MTPIRQASVIICTHDESRFEWLTRAVESVVTQRPSPHEVIVVVDHNPRLLERATRQLQGVRVVPNAEATGLSGARNTGIRTSLGEVVAFLDDDAEARPGWLDVLLAAYDSEEVIGVGGSIAPNWQTRAPAWFPEEYLWVVGCSYRGMPRRRSHVRNLLGCNMSFRRTVFESVGGFRQGVGRGRGLPLGCEETELCIRATKGIPGAAMVYEPDAIVDHHVPASRGRISYFLVRCYAEGISKAYVVRYVGGRAGMQSEARYLLRTLTSGIALHILSLRSGSPNGLARAAMLPAGLVAFGCGYLRGLARFHAEEADANVTLPQIRD